MKSVFFHKKRDLLIALVLIVIAVVSFFGGNKVYAITDICEGAAGCQYSSDCEKRYPGGQECETFGKVCCDKVKKEEEGVTIPVIGDSWLEEIFGSDGLKLNIPKPIKVWDVEGTASFWSILSWGFSVLWVLQFFAFIVAVVIGAIKWISSQGEPTKLEAAQKWMKNALMGFAATILIFVGVNFFTWMFGLGDIFDLAQNLAVCEGEVLYEWKRDNNQEDARKCECTDSGWGNCE